MELKCQCGVLCDLRGNSSVIIWSLVTWLHMNSREQIPSKTFAAFFFFWNRNIQNGKGKNPH